MRASEAAIQARSRRAPRRDFLVFGAPLVEEEEIQDVVSVLRSGWIGTGPKVAEFEREFARYVNATNCAAVNSCTAALHLALLAAGVGPGDEVITTAMTFCATVNAIVHTGATPVLADCDPQTMNIDPGEVQRRITPKTKAIVPVHFAGRLCDMDALGLIAESRGLKIIEDCAHAIETERGGRKAGSFGDFGCFSFYVTKNLTTGEGGMVVCRSEEDAARIKVLALHGMSKDAWKRYSDDGYKHYEVVHSGFKYNMMDLQAAIGIQQLRRIERNLLRRQAIWEEYDAQFRNLPLTLPGPPEPNSRHARHLYTILIDEREAGLTRDQMLTRLHQRNIGSGVHYRAIPAHEYYRSTYGWSMAEFPNAARIGEQTLSLPLSAKLSDEDVEDVIDAVRSVFN